MAETDDDNRLGLSFIILGDMEMPDPKKVMNAAHSMGIEMCLIENDEQPKDSYAEGTDIISFDIGNDSALFVAMMPVPHPDVEEMSRGPLSPDDLSQLVEGPAHLIVTANGLEGTTDKIDIRMSALTASVLAGCNAVGVLKMPGILFHRPELYADVARESSEAGELPMLICIDITAGREPDGELSLLTHNMQRYGREDFYIIVGEDASGAMDYVLNLVSWMLADRDYHLPTGDTVGRTADEKIKVQRVSNPTGEGENVIKLELP